MLPLIPLIVKVVTIGIKVSKAKAVIEKIIALTKSPDREPILPYRVDPEIDNPPHAQKEKTD